MWPLHFKDWNKLGTVYNVERARQMLINIGVPENSILLRDTGFRAIEDKDFDGPIKDTYCTFGDINYLDKVFECEDFADKMVSEINQGWRDKMSKPEALAHFGGYMQGQVLAKTGDIFSHAWYWRVRPNGEFVYYEAQTGRLLDWEIVRIDFASA